MRGNRITVIKLGGSFAGSRYLAGWVEVLANSGGRSVVVPGGGPFANAVRHAQPKLGFSDAVAHHLALLAMEQFGQVLASLSSNFVIVYSAAKIRRALHAGDVPIWSPTRMVLRRPEIVPSWDVTSDSLAAWLAGHIGAEQIVLVKHGGPFGNPVRAVDLADRGVVDQAFPRFLAASGALASIVAAKNYASAARVIRSRGTLGTSIDLHQPGVKRLLPQLWPTSKNLDGDGR
jgi:5-(aminomethyl)-3-furanmethanol phosphate kinase